MPSKVPVDRRMRLSLPVLVRQGRVLPPGGRLDFVIGTDLARPVVNVLAPAAARFTRKDEARRGLGARVLQQRRARKNF